LAVLGRLAAVQEAFEVDGRRCKQLEFEQAGPATAGAVDAGR
jgi:hypothetical protein